MGRPHQAQGGGIPRRPRDDDTPRLVYADWLQENGAAAKGFMAAIAKATDWACANADAAAYSPAVSEGNRALTTSRSTVVSSAIPMSPTTTGQR